MLKYRKISFSPEVELDTIGEQIKDSDGYDGIEFYGDRLQSRPDLFNFLEMCKTTGYKRLKFSAQAEQLTDIQFVKRLVESGVYIFEITTLGLTKELNAGLSNLRAFNGYRDPSFSLYKAVRIILTKENIDHIADITGSVIPFGLDRVVLLFDDYRMKMSKVAPYLSGAIEMCLLNMVWVVTENMPLCLQPEVIEHVGAIYAHAEWETVKGENCVSCLYNDSCEGIEKGYTGMHGFDEFKPVTSGGYAADIKGLRR